MATETAVVTWEQAVADEVGKIYVDRFDEGVRFVILRGPGSLCAYLGVPADHPLAGFSYEDLPINCHGGLTYGDKGAKMLPEGYFWYGYDYAHAGDYSFYDTEFCAKSTDKKWTLAEVEKDSWEALYDFRKLMRLAEGIAKKSARAAEGA